MLVSLLKFLDRRRVFNRKGCTLFFCINSAAVEALKVLNKVVVETGFPCIPTIKKVMNEGALISEGCTYIK